MKKTIEHGLKCFDAYNEVVVISRATVELDDGRTLVIDVDQATPDYMAHLDRQIEIAAAS